MIKQVLHGIQLDYATQHILITTSQRILTFDYLVNRSIYTVLL